MSRSFAGRLLVALLLVVGAIVVAVLAYHAGVTAGLGSAGSAGSGTVTPYAWGYAWHGAIGFPWFFLWPLVPLFFLVLFFLLIRAVAWGGRGGWGGGWGRGPWGAGGPSDGPATRLDEWHRRAHQADAGQGTEADGTKSTDR